MSRAPVASSTSSSRSLSPRGPGNSGLTPILKIAQSLLQEIRHLALPVPSDLRPPADGVEDELTAAPQAARKLTDALGHLRLVLGIELIVAAQAMDLRGAEPAPAVAATVAAIREIVAPLDEDRAFGGEIERLDEVLLATGALLIRAGVPALPAHA
ncbi:MAG: aromatic amino acid lyase [Kiloniellaceae bacterium]